MHHRRKHISQPLMFRTLRGQLVGVRQAMATDNLLLAELLCRLSERALHLRYMRSGRFSAETIWNEAVRMARGHTRDHTTLVATTRLNEYDEAVAVAELVRDGQIPTVGEIALVVRDDEQQQGIGTFLLWRLLRVAQLNGITSLSANMLADNSAMLRLICALGLPYTATTRYGEIQVIISIPGHHKEESTMNWEQWFCPNQACADAAWMVQRAPTMYEVWWVAAPEDERPFTIAATAPVCPRCGMTLLALLELEGRRDRQVGAEVGPVFDFVRSLA